CPVTRPELCRERDRPTTRNATHPSSCTEIAPFLGAYFRCSALPRWRRPRAPAYRLPLGQPKASAVPWAINEPFFSSRVLLSRRNTQAAGARRPFRHVENCRAGFQGDSLVRAIGKHFASVLRAVSEGAGFWSDEV